MDIYVLDGLNGIVDIVDTFESVIWNMQYYGSNDFELIVPGTSDNIAKLALDRYLVRNIDVVGSDTFENIMIIEKRKLTFDIEKGWILTVSGGGLKRLLARRIVWNQTNITGSLEDAIRQIITDNVINPVNLERKIDNFILDDPIGIDTKTDLQLQNENICDWLVTTCQANGIGWDVYISGGKYIFTLIQGVDRSFDQNRVIPVIFSPEYDNLIRSEHEIDLTEYKNAAIVGGEGEGIDQRTVVIGDASGLDRYETYIDGSGVSSNGEIITLETYMKMLEDFGYTELVNNGFTEKVEGDIIANGMYTFNEDYFIGDVVQIVNINDLQAKSRTIEAIYSEDDQGNKLIPTFSDWNEKKGE